MAVRAVVLDLDGTLIDVAGTAVPGVVDMIARLRAVGIRVVIASNRDGAAAKASIARLPHDLLLDHRAVGSNKGTKDWVAAVRAEWGLGENEIVWLGNSDLDMREAVNSKVPYFNAGWSLPDYEYGVNLMTPALFSAVIRECFAKPVDWFCQMGAADAIGRPVVVKALTDSRGGGDDAFRDTLRRFLKDRADFQYGALRFGDVVALHLLGSLYGAGLAAETDVWTIYPGSRGDANQSLGPFISSAARLFHRSYVGDLLIRHRPALDSGQTRNRGLDVSFPNQIDTVCLNPARRARIRGKRIVVVDDFETAGNSLECARNLLLQAGAATMSGICVGKYMLKGHGWSRLIWSPRPGYSWDPYAAVEHDADAFDFAISQYEIDPRGPRYFRESCERLSQEWADGANSP